MLLLLSLLGSWNFGSLWWSAPWDGCTGTSWHSLPQCGHTLIGWWGDKLAWVVGIAFLHSGESGHLGSSLAFPPCIGFPPLCKFWSWRQKMEWQEDWAVNQLAVGKEMAMVPQETHVAFMATCQWPKSGFWQKNMDVSGHAGYNCKTMLFSTMCKHHVFWKEWICFWQTDIVFAQCAFQKSGQLKKNVPKINSHPHQSDLWT